jgi:7-keto-8-aminopelargonate synthetase-like enzyme
MTGGVSQLFIELASELELIRSKGKLREFHPATILADRRVGTRGKELVDLTSWDRLGISRNSDYLRAIGNIFNQSSLSQSSNRFCSGTHPAIVELESRLAKFFQAESALIFSSKNQAILSLITAVCGENDLVAYETEGTLPVADAAVLAGAQTIPFSADKLGELTQDLERRPKNCRKLVFVESISPTRFEATPLKELVDVVNRTGAHLIVDESSALAAVGLRGAGLAESLGLGRLVLATVGSLDRGLMGGGGFAVGAGILIGAIVQRSKTLVNESAPSPLLSASASIAIGSVELAVKQREFIKLKSERIIVAAKSAGMDASGLGVAAIHFPGLGEAQLFGDALVQRGFLTEVVDTARFRKSGAAVRMLIPADLSEEQLLSLERSIDEVSKRQRNDKNI